MINDFQTKFRGLTGHVEFDSNGYRSNLLLDVIGLDADGVKKVGVWNSSSEAEPFPVVALLDDPVESDLRNRMLTVILTLVGYQKFEMSFWILDEVFQYTLLSVFKCWITV